MLRLLVDFNEVSKGVVVGLLEDLADVEQIDPEPGRVVKLHDDEGEACFGTIDRVDNGLVYATVDWSKDRCAYCLQAFRIRDGVGNNLACYCSTQCQAADTNEASPRLGGYTTMNESGRFHLAR